MIHIRGKTRNDREFKGDNNLTPVPQAPIQTRRLSNSTLFLEGGYREEVAPEPPVLHLGVDIRLRFRL